MDGVDRLNILCEENELIAAKEEAIVKERESKTYNGFQKKASKMILYSRFTKSVLKYSDTGIYNIQNNF